MLRKDLTIPKKLLSCCVRRWQTPWVTRYCIVDSKLFKFYKDPER